MTDNTPTQFETVADAKAWFGDNEVLEPKCAA